MKKTANRSSTPKRETLPQERLRELMNAALGVAKKARKHSQSLNGANFYANKMADLRADATIAFGQMSGKSVGDTTALAELMQKVFSVDASPKDRTQAARELQFALKTTWADTPADQSHLEEGGVFPLVTLNQTKRGYLVAVGRQLNGCYASGWYDGCAVMMRRLLESVIIEAFEASKLDAKIKDPTSGDFVQLTAIIKAALAEPSWNVSIPHNSEGSLSFRQARAIG
jgi:hypothetical protein